MSARQIMVVKKERNVVTLVVQCAVWTQNKKLSHLLNLKDSMKLLTTFLLVGLLALWMGFPSTTGSHLPTGKQSPQKPGECPKDLCKCSHPRPNLCERDDDCRGRQKCCYICCALRCANPRFSG
ncbi:waprin-Enh1-like [Ahaetulla prasina]|uniref:waprin-Enh1-like n=1 Tax=Ahaetulla prasina TaxID=499056 RepID=UPI00264868C0|nr:waprin-Enh1-like [Ahaetulla prasina]